MLTSDDLEYSVELGDDIAERLAELTRVGDGAPPTSGTRGAMVEALEAIRDDMFEAVEDDNLDMLLGAAAELADLETTRIELQDFALLTLAGIYADKRDALALFAAGSPSPFEVPFRAVWARAVRLSRSKLPSGTPPDEARVFAVVHAERRMEVEFGNWSRRTRVIRELGWVNGDDVRFLELAVALETWKGMDQAMGSFLRHRSRTEAVEAALEATETSVGDAIWGIVGYDSFYDFVVDAGLFVVTGGVASARKFVKVVRRGRRTARRISGAKRLQKVLRQHERDLKRTAAEMEKIRKRVASSRNARRVQRSKRRAKRLTREYGQFVDAIWDTLSLIVDAEVAAKYRPGRGLTILQEYAKAVGEARRELIKLSATLAAERQLSAATGDVVLGRLRQALDPVYGDRIRRGRDVFLASLVRPQRAAVRALLRWFLALLVRELVVRLYFETAHGRSGTAKNLADLIEESIAQCIEEMVGSVLPDGPAGDVTAGALSYMKDSRLVQQILTEL